MSPLHMIMRIRVADSGTLLHIRDMELKHLIGITDAERNIIKAEINKRFGQLNQAAVGPQKPRWT